MSKEISLNRKRLLEIKEEVKEFHPLLEALFKKLPYIIDVEYTHGRDEMGADFVLKKTDDVLDEITYIGIIGKIGKVVQDFTDIERQIVECGLPRFTNGGKQEIQLSEVWIVLTDNITTGAQKKIHHLFPLRNIKFLQGKDIEKLIDKYLPAYWSLISPKISSYIGTIREENARIDNEISLLQGQNKGFYIEQDVYLKENSTRKLAKFGTSSKKVEIKNIVKNNRITLIEGSMGAGKSKLLRKLVDYFTTPDVFNNEKILPVITNYKTLIDDFDGKIEEQLQVYLREAETELTDDSKILLLIDGIDEKDFSVDEQIKSLESIIEQIDNIPNVNVVLTSRFIKGFGEEYVSSRRLKRLELKPLTLDKIISFIEKICTKTNFSKKLVSDLRKSSLFKQLPQSPIAAILLAKLINDNTKEIPSNLTELYAKYLELIMGRWDIDKGLQSQKEYDVLNFILTELAEYFIENELPEISIDEVKQRFNNYLDKRNLGVDSNSIFQKMLNRCEIISTNQIKGTLFFKHKSFAEFLYAKKILFSRRDLEINERVFTTYWFNIYFFYIGMLKDCSEILEAIQNLELESEQALLAKISNMGNYYLAAYTTPYDVIQEGVKKIILEASQLYIESITINSKSLLSSLPQLFILTIIRGILKDSLSFEFFENAIEYSAVSIDYEINDEQLKIYSLFFLNAINIELGKSNDFSFLVEKYKYQLPLDITGLILSTSAENSRKSAALKRLDKNFRELLRRNKSARNLLKQLIERPAKELK